MSDKHPMQPLVLVDGVIRFKENAIVRNLLDTGALDLNAIVRMVRQGLVTKDDYTQFMQLIGCSVSGFEELDELVDRRVISTANRRADKLVSP